MLVDTHGSLVCSAILKENDTYTTLTQGERATAESLMQQFLHGEGLAGWAMKHRRTIMTRDATQDARWLTGNAPADRERRAMVVVPLVVGNQAMGVVNLSHPEVGHFTSRQVILLEAIGSIMGTMVDGIRRSATRVTLVEQTQQALAELRDELTRLRAAFTAIDEGMMILDRQGRLLFMNPSAETMLGSPASFLQGHTFNDLLESTLSVERRELLVQLDSNVRAQIDPAVEQTIPLQQLQFGDRPYTLLVHPVHETDRTLLGVIVTLRDITLELPIIQAETELTSNVTHALRTPLTSIKGYTDLLLLGAVGEINEQQRDFLKRVETNTDRLNQLITDLTDLSRIENRILQLQLEDVDVVSLVHEVLEERQAELISHGIENKLTMPLDLPPVRADRERFRQMLNQLLTNAVNYTEPNGRIGISTRIDNNYVVVSVWDSGIGIASEDLARAGTKFFRADHPYVSRVPGFGLGLALVRGLAELQGGRLTITSTMNVGTIVSLTLPISPVLPADEYIPDGEAQAAGLE
jgi:PAS domain S-box-containing protein